MKGFHKISLIALLALIGCSRHSEELPRCWNISSIRSVNIHGSGAFILSMDGMSLQSPDCSSGTSPNDFELSEDVKSKILEFTRDKSLFSGTLEFKFQARIENQRSNKVIYIYDIYDLSYGRKLKWMDYSD